MLVKGGEGSALTLFQVGACENVTYTTYNPLTKRKWYPFGLQILTKVLKKNEGNMGKICLKKNKLNHNYPLYIMIKTKFFPELSSFLCQTVNSQKRLEGLSPFH